MRISLVLAAPLIVSLAGAAVSSAAPTQAGQTTVTKADWMKLEVVATGLQQPWAMTFTPDGKLWFTERDTGQIREISPDGKLAEKPLFKVPNLRGGGEIGLMGLCLHPDFAKNGFAYTAFGHEQKPTDEEIAAAEKAGEKKPRSKVDIRVLRLKYSEGTLSEDKLIITGFPAGRNHAGCCVAFGPDGKLYISTGEMFKKELAQDPESLGGKILRLNDDGTVPQDNPFVGKAGYRPEIFTLGHRNPQGLAWQPGTGAFWSVEHGPSGEAGTGGDEVNLIKKGMNYGWPTIHHKEAKEGLINPLIEWTPAIAPAEAIFCSSDKVPQLKGKFIFTALGGLRGSDAEPGLYVLTIDGETVTKQERLAANLGRLRAIAQGPDGYVYFATSNTDGRGNAYKAKDDDRIFRIKAAQ